MRFHFKPRVHSQKTAEFCEKDREEANELSELIGSAQKYSTEAPINHKKLHSSHQHQYKHVNYIDELPILTFSDYMHYVMFDNQNGFYGSGKVNFKRDFATNATRDKGLAFINFMDMFRQWLDAGQPEKFNNYEGGGGDGRLAFHTLCFAEQLAKINLSNNEHNLIWLKFYESLCYIIVELSPKLVQIQTDLCQNYINQRKLIIINASVIEFNPTRKIHRFCSNELLDDLPLEGFTKDNSGQIFALVKLQVLPTSHFTTHKSTSELEYEALSQDQYYRSHIQLITDISNIPCTVYIVNQKFLSMLPDKFKENAKYYDIWLPIIYNKKLLNHLKENIYVLSNLEYGKITYFSIYLEKLAQTIHSADRILFFDYGGVYDQITQNVRHYHNISDEEQNWKSMQFLSGCAGYSHYKNMPKPQKNMDDIFVNITHDVNYTAVMCIFEKYLFKVDLYGHQSYILNCLDSRLVEQALHMLYKDIEKNVIIDEEGLTVIDSRQFLFQDLQGFNYQDCSFRFIVLKRQPTLAKTYYGLPDLIANFNLWRRYDRRFLEQQKESEQDKKTGHDKLRLITYQTR